MDSRLFQIDPYAGISYGLYNSIKGDKGSFEDFLLHYDSTGANNEDSSWLTKLVKDDNNKALSSPAVWEAMNTLGVNGLDLMSSVSSSDFFDTQASALKLQLMQAFSKREDYAQMKPLLEQLMS
ncbi:hypothetical protein FA592_09080 [Sulfurospirillum diekertiae]|uniref:Uncharacterized protein n=1 Tax=Sulfurospirillum diekertiae TaxID=1854492 RepID=A0A290HAT5_9BACT|nr:hypothetical protein [Sulfurospirillum diekertiae]ATB68535.1 hypothetical protein SJPD1_0407 [Sulfurospirillum diekertiae]QIR76381.1 hypothetical protein FA584_09245 [Sulfurospirillum diekertiae]QIR79007.1 hypothetical protein FA592_09080 [Sulfurospirillum diekertiae]